MRSPPTGPFMSGGGDFRFMIGRARCITGKQHSVMADKIMETQRLFYAWAKSDQKRMEKG